MSHELGEEEGRIETCIYRAPDNEMNEEDLELALDVALTMNALFELALDDNSGFMEDVKSDVEAKIKQIMLEANEEEDKEEGPMYTSEGNILKINRYTKTKGSC